MAAILGGQSICTIEETNKHNVTATFRHKGLLLVCAPCSILHRKTPPSLRTSSARAAAERHSSCTKIEQACLYLCNDKHCVFLPLFADDPNRVVQKHLVPCHYRDIKAKNYIPNCTSQCLPHDNISLSAIKVLSYLIMCLRL